MNTAEEQERIAHNVRRTAGHAALREIRAIVDKDLHEDAVRARLLRIFLRYGWIVLLLLAAVLARYLGVF